MTSQNRTQSQIQRMRRHLLSRDGLAGILALLSYPLWWVLANEFCISQPPIFAILTCASLAIYGIKSANIISISSGFINFGYATNFTLNWICGDYSTKLPMFVISIFASLCLAIFIYKFYPSARQE